MEGLGISRWMQLRASSISLWFIFKSMRKCMERSAFCRYRPQLYSVSHHSACWHSSLSFFFFIRNAFCLSLPRNYPLSARLFPISSASDSHTLWSGCDTRNPPAGVRGHLTSTSVPSPLKIPCQSPIRRRYPRFQDAVPLLIAPPPLWFIRLEWKGRIKQVKRQVLMELMVKAAYSNHQTVGRRDATLK